MVTRHFLVRSDFVVMLTNSASASEYLGAPAPVPSLFHSGFVLRGFFEKEWAMGTGREASSLEEAAEF